MNEVIHNILTRRSIRAYKEEQIKDTDLNLILEGARYAPSGGNSQSWNFVVLQNEAKLLELNKCIRAQFDNLEVDENTYVSLKRSKVAAKNDDYNFFYHAPTLVIVSNDKEYANAMADSAAAIENILLTAHSLGIGACWINQLTWFGDKPQVRNILTEYGIPQNYKICGAVSLGYSAMVETKRLPRKETAIRIIK